MQEDENVVNTIALKIDNSITFMKMEILRHHGFIMWKLTLQSWIESKLFPIRNQDYRQHSKLSRKFNYHQKEKSQQIKEAQSATQNAETVYRNREGHIISEKDAKLTQKQLLREKNNLIVFWLIDWWMERRSSTKENGKGKRRIPWKG